MYKDILNIPNKNIIHAEKYASKYFKDLQKHLKLTDAQMIRVLKNCMSNLKKRNFEKKWWKIF